LVTVFVSRGWGWRKRVTINKITITWKCQRSLSPGSRFDLSKEDFGRPNKHFKKRIVGGSLFVLFFRLQCVYIYVLATYEKKRKTDHTSVHILRYFTLIEMLTSTEASRHSHTHTHTHIPTPTCEQVHHGFDKSRLIRGNESCRY
jgi:hypothetical protein